MSGWIVVFFVNFELRGLVKLVVGVGEVGKLSFTCLKYLGSDFWFGSVIGICKYWRFIVADDLGFVV